VRECTFRGKMSAWVTAPAQPGRRNRPTAVHSRRLVCGLPPRSSRRLQAQFRWSPYA
jgi:hypothetical protein